MKKSDGPTPVIPFGLSNSSMPSASRSSNVFTLGDSNSSSNFNPLISSAGGNIYEQEMAMRGQYFAARRRAMEDSLKKNFPTKALVVNCVGLALASILAIIMQTLQLVYENSLYYVGSGYWVSAINAILIALALVFC